MLVQLQYIRAIAALLVVYFHAILQLQKLAPDAWLNGYLFGKSGVDLFFVLSGFVMWITTCDKPMSVGDFWWRRIRRIVPLYWAMTLFAATVAFVMPQILKSTQFDVPHILASLAFLPWINPADPEGRMIAPVIVPGWTLNFEMFFYLLFGFCLLLPRQLRLAGLVALIAAIFLVCTLVLPDLTVGRFYGDSVIFEFVAGAVLGHLYKTGHRLPVAAAGVMALFGFAALLYLDFLEIDLPRFFTIGIPSILVVYAATSVEVRERRSFHWLQVLGDASYSIYLTHAFTLAGMRMIYPLVMPILQSDALFVVAMMIASSLIGLASYYLFELPVGRLLASVRFSRSTRTVPAQSA